MFKKNVSLIAVVLAVFLSTGSLAFSQKGGHGSHSSRTSTKTPKAPKIKKESSSKCESCPRDKHGKIKRSKEETRAFQRQNPCPSTGKTSGKCHGYVIDHIIPLAEGGADDPSNMQWQTKEAAKAKDKTERRKP